MWSVEKRPLLCVIASLDDLIEISYCNLEENGFWPKVDYMDQMVHLLNQIFSSS